MPMNYAYDLRFSIWLHRSGITSGLDYRSVAFIHLRSHMLLCGEKLLPCDFLVKRFSDELSINLSYSEGKQSALMPSSDVAED